jgi:putative addiction module antidote
MRVRETVIRPIGNSAGVTIPKETLEKYDLSPGDKIFLQETADGILVTAHDPLVQKAMEIYRKGAKKYRNAMRELSNR